jgi:hypothetical protein
MSLFPEDKRAAFIGAIATTAILFVIAFAISRITTAAHTGGEHAPAAAGAASGH